jgi:hypothetical protein
MICQHCLSAGSLNSIKKFDEAQAKHRECNTDCGCQHRVGDGLTKQTRKDDK